MENQKTNTFAEMQKNQAIPEEKIQQPHPHPEPRTTSKEIKMDEFSDVAVGDKVKYNRPDLAGTIDIVDKFQIFYPDTTVTPFETEHKTAKYWKPEILLLWKSVNQDGIQNKEYVSGAKVWLNKDGQPSKDISFWYKGGAEAENQSCILWETIAKALQIEPDRLAPRQFVGFLNMQPKFKIVAQKTKNYKAKPGEPAFIYKNMPGEFIPQ